MTFNAGSLGVLESFWKVMEIENAIFQDLECFGKERIFKMALEIYSIFIWKSSKNILEEIVALCRIKHRICYVCSSYYL